MKLAKYPLLVLGALALVAGQALSERGSDAISGTRSFSIDGRRFLVSEPNDKHILIEGELARRGIHAPRVSDNLACVPTDHAVEALREEPPAPSTSSLPADLAPEHVLRLETASGRLEIAFGHLARSDKDALGRLRTKGWEWTKTSAGDGVGTIAHSTNGKEASFVFFDKNEGRFLAIRRAAR